MATNRAPGTHRQPVHNTGTMVYVCARPNPSCVHRDIVLTDRTLSFACRLRQRFRGGCNLGLSRCDGDWIQKVGREIENEGRSVLSRTNGVLENSVGQLQKRDLVHHVSHHNRVSDWRPELVDGSTEKLVASLHESINDVCECVVFHITCSQRSV